MCVPLLVFFKRIKLYLACILMCIAEFLINTIAKQLQYVNIIIHIHAIHVYTALYMYIDVCRYVHVYAYVCTCI